MNILGADLPPLHRELIKLVHFNLGLSILSVMFPYSPPKNNLIDLMKSTTNNTLLTSRSGGLICLSFVTGHLCRR